MNVIAFVSDHGFDADICDPVSVTPLLLYTVVGGHFERCKLVLKRVANVNRRYLEDTRTWSDLSYIAIFRC